MNADAYLREMQLEWMLNYIIARNQVTMLPAWSHELFPPQPEGALVLRPLTAEELGS